MKYNDLAELDEAFVPLSPEAAEQVEISLKYQGYLARQQQQTEKFRKSEQLRLPEDTDYMQLQGLRIEARQKLNAQRPANLGQAARIPGVSPGDIAVLLIYLEKRRREEATDE